ncbi:MAG: lysylphosphatidylglycerol synthase transmembrane domain-containing protein [Mucilaginibacter sp.]
MVKVKTEPNNFFTPSRIIFYVFSIIVFFLAVHYIGKLKDIEKLMMQMEPAWLLLAVSTQILTYLIYALIVRLLVKDKPGTTDFLLFFKLSIAIMFVNQVLPTGGISGDGYIFNQLIKRKVSRYNAFTAMVLESISYYAAILIFLLIFYTWYLNLTTGNTILITYTVILGFVFYVLLFVLVLIVSNGHNISFVIHKLERFGFIKRLIEKANLLSVQNESEGTFKMLGRKKKEIAQTIILQLVIILSDVVTVWALIKGFHVDMPFALVAFGLLLSLVIGALPISPGSLIVYESAMTYFFTRLGAPVHAALIITLLYRFLTFWLPIPIGLLVYRNLQKKRKILSS